MPSPVAPKSVTERVRGELLSILVERGSWTVGDDAEGDDWMRGTEIWRIIIVIIS